jgi:hypothetical protein
MTNALTGIGTSRPSRSRASSASSRARAGAENSLSTGISIVPSNSAVTVKPPMRVVYQPGPSGRGSARVAVRPASRHSSAKILSARGR